MVFNFLTSFTESAEYKTWSHNVDVKDDFLSQAMRRLMHHEYYTNKELLEFAKRDEFESRGLDYVHFKCIDDIYESYYLHNFVKTSEFLPIGITLSQVVRDKQGSTDFVVIYANEVYSLMTGYIRKEIVGRKFTELNREEQYEYEKCNKYVTDKLRQASSLVIKLNNHCKNGDPFQQLLGTKSIFDSKGTYSYLIGIHADITIDYGIFWSDRLIKSLLSKLPSILSSIELQHASVKYTCVD